MNQPNGTSPVIYGVTIPQVSPWFHRAGVKPENVGKSHIYKKKQLSLFMFLPFTPTHPRDARPRVSACVREEGGEKVKPAIRYSRAKTVR